MAETADNRRAQQDDQQPQLRAHRVNSLFVESISSSKLSADLGAAALRCSSDWLIQYSGKPIASGTNPSSDSILA